MPETTPMMFDLGQRRKERAFEQTVRAYSADLFRFAYWLCRDRQVAEDVVQESFARAWKAWDELEKPESVKSWLLTIVRREHARLYERKQFDYADEQPEDLQIAVEHEPLELMELEQVIGTLPESLREPLLLQALGGFSCAEIAEQLGTSEGAVMVRLTRARQALRAVLTPAGEYRSQTK